MNVVPPPLLNQPDLDRSHRPNYRRHEGSVRVNQSSLRWPVRIVEQPASALIRIQNESARLDEITSQDLLPYAGDSRTNIILSSCNVPLMRMRHWSWA